MNEKFDRRCRKIRKDIVGIARSARRGHLPAALSIVEILVVLYDHILRFRAGDPVWADRDRFILSKGHGCMALYAILADKGFIPEKALSEFCSFDGILGGHPTREKVPGVEASTGSLGHGLPIGVGMAVNARLEKKDYRVFVLLGDGECDEGSVWEAAMAASQHKLDNLVALVDYNKHQSFASTKVVCDLEPFAEKWKAFGFETRDVDMQKNPLGLQSLLSGLPQAKGKPTAVICHTIKGKGFPFMENDLSWHHKSKITDAEMDRIASALEG